MKNRTKSLTRRAPEAFASWRTDARQGWVRVGPFIIVRTPKMNESIKRSFDYGRELERDLVRRELESRGLGGRVALTTSSARHLSMVPKP